MIPAYVPAARPLQEPGRQRCATTGVRLGRPRATNLAPGEIPRAQSIQYVVARSSVPHSGQLQACLARFRLTRFKNYQLKLEFLGCGGQVFHMMRISG